MDQPKLITTPFAQDAPSSAVDEIPETLAPSDPIQNASWTQGFPNVTMVPLAAGGIPPRGQSMNGVLKAISEHSAYVGGGGQYKWDQDWVDAKGGYAKGAVLQSDDGLASYVSAVDNNTDNFNSNPSSIGTSWLPYSGAVKIDSAGTGLIQDGTALRVNFGTTAGTVMQGDDSRIVNALQRGNNLSDITDSATARGNLGLGTAATRDVGTDSGDVLEVGASRLGQSSNPQTAFNLNTDGMQHGLGFYYLGSNVGVIGSSFMLSSPAFAGTEYSFNNRKAYVFFGNNSEASGSKLVARYELHTTGNILSTTGQSTQYPMTQKAVTDAINNSAIGVGQTWSDVTSEIINNTVRTNTTGRPIQVIISGGRTGSPNAQVYIDGILAAGWGGSEHDELSITFTLPSGGSYKVVNIPQAVFFVLELK